MRRMMTSGFTLEPQLVKVSKLSAQVAVLSNGDALKLSLDATACPIYSVLDGNGAVVRAMHGWLRSLSRRVGLSVSPGTIEQYGRTLSYLCRWLESSQRYPNTSIDEQLRLLNRSDITQWLRDMKGQGAESHYTLHSREACAKSFLDWMATVESGNLRDPQDSPWGRNGTLRYVTASPNARTPKFISTEIVVSVLQGMYNECERCMFHAQYDMGLRVSELVNLTVGDIPDDSMYDPAFEFIPICARRVKGRGGQRPLKTTLISRAVLKRIKRYHSSREYKLAPDWDIDDPRKPAFLTANQLKWSPRNASKQFKNAVRRTGMTEDLSTQWMRHGAAHSVLRSDMGKDYQDRMLIVQQMLAHRWLKTTEVYTQISPALLQKLTKAGKEMNRLGEAELIREQTFLGPLKHSEKRGHHA